MRELRPLPGSDILRRSDGRSWAEVLEPVLRDTADLPAGANLRLTELDWLVRKALEELVRQPFPRVFIHLRPTELASLDAESFGSFLVTHRAERLVQLTELSAGALHALEVRSLQLSAVAARALFEVATVSYDVHGAVLREWRKVRSAPEDIRAVVSNPESNLWRSLWSARMGSRVEGDGQPKAVNIVTRLRKVPPGSDESSSSAMLIYERLCEATHPNSEANAALWRRIPGQSEGPLRLRFEPSGSQSPVKIAIVEAVLSSYVSVINFCRDLWWIAAEIACALDWHRTEDRAELGLPFKDRKPPLCCCNSGLPINECTHPEPLPLSAIWLQP
jgi:hypothetical protein